MSDFLTNFLADLDESEPKAVRVDVPGWAHPVYVRLISISETQQFTKAHAGDETSNPWVRNVLRMMCDADGVRQPVDEDTVKKLERQPVHRLVAIQDAFLALNGLTNESAENLGNG